MRYNIIRYMKGANYMSNIEYLEDGDLAIYNGYSFRRDKKTGYYLSSKKIGDKRKRLHVYVYECEKGKIPKGYDIHHLDADKTNNNIDNLEILTKSAHEKKHGTMLSESDREFRRTNVVANAMPKAKEWHSTQEGKEWHSKHAKEVYNNLPLNKYICTYCKSEFETKNIYPTDSNRFCSNKCKSAFRRASGVDNEERICEYCGEKYIINKYRKIKYCEKHRNKKDRV